MTAPYVRWTWEIERLSGGVPIAATYRPEDWASMTREWEPTPEQAVVMIRREDEWLLYGRGDTPTQRVARLLADAGWTDAALRPAAEKPPLDPEGIWYVVNRNPAPVVRRRPKSRKRKKT